MNLHVAKSVSMVLLSILISACHHENPLKTYAIKQSAEFIVNASANSEKRLHLPIQKDSYGFAYLECMEGKKTKEIRCEELYQSMLSFAQEGQYPHFQKLSLNDLTDKEVFFALADDYAEFAATNWPTFHAKG